METRENNLDHIFFFKILACEGYSCLNIVVIVVEHLGDYVDQRMTRQWQFQTYIMEFMSQLYNPTVLVSKRHI